MNVDDFFSSQSESKCETSENLESSSCTNQGKILFRANIHNIVSCIALENAATCVPPSLIQIIQQLSYLNEVLKNESQPSCFAHLVQLASRFRVLGKWRRLHPEVDCEYLS